MYLRGRRGVSQRKPMQLNQHDSLSTRELDQVLDTIDDRQRSVSVPLSNIASLEPAIFGDRLGGELVLLDCDESKSLDT